MCLKSPKSLSVSGGYIDKKAPIITAKSDSHRQVVVPEQRMMGKTATLKKFFSKKFEKK
jgi:hypothetical protein